MATYADIFNLYNNSDLRNRVSVACLVAATAIISEAGSITNHANRMIWAKLCFSSPESVATPMLMAVLAANNSATVAQITGVTDVALQTIVNAQVNAFATG